MSLEIVQIPVLDDNYIYLLRDVSSNQVAVVDPAEAEPVARVLKQKDWPLHFILNTHHHPDHVGGNRELEERFDAVVVGPRADRERIPQISLELGEGDSFSLGESVAQVFDTPGHTRGHIVYYFTESQALFCGDTLFSLGCGRLFEGSPQQMWSSLLKLRRLPDQTLVYCAHEYTEANARFARSIDPENRALQDYQAEVRALRQEGRATIPSKLGLEKICNPFLRVDDIALQNQLDIARPIEDPVEVFAAIRQMKDQFR